jgi:hypothetical protein
MRARIPGHAVLGKQRFQFLRQRRSGRNRFIEIQSAICGEKCSYRQPRYFGHVASHEIPTSGPVAQYPELAADNRLVASSSPSSPRWRLITAWLEVRVLSAPPHSPSRTEIFLPFVETPRIGAVVCDRSVSANVRSDFGDFLHTFVSGGKIPFPG